MGHGYLTFRRDHDGYRRGPQVAGIDEPRRGESWRTLPPAPVSRAAHRGAMRRGRRFARHDAGIASMASMATRPKAIDSRGAGARSAADLAGKARSILVAHPSPDVYGSDRQLLESLAGMRAAGWAVTVHLPGRGPLVDLMADVSVRVQPFPVLRKALLRPRAFARLALTTPRDLVRLVRTIRAAHPDAVYVNTVTIPLWILAARLTRTPVLVHVHEAEEDAPRIIRIALLAPLLLASSVIANSEASRRVLVDVMPRLASRTTVVPNGIPDTAGDSADLAEPGRLALVARLSPRKGVDVALEAVALLRGLECQQRVRALGRVPQHPLDQLR